MITNSDILNLDFPDEGDAFSYSYEILREQKKRFNENVINNPDDAYNFMIRYCDENNINNREFYKIILLDNNREIIDVLDVYEEYYGSIFQYSIFQSIFNNNASAFILFKDYLIDNFDVSRNYGKSQFIEDINDIANSLGIEFCDYIVSNNKEFVSYALENNPDK